MRVTTALFSATLLLFSLATEAEPAKQPTKRPLKFSNVPFTVDVDKIPKDFAGSDPIALLKGLLKSPEPAKREFETKDEFADRYDNWLTRNILGSLTPTSTIAFVFSPAILPLDQVLLEYDADKAEMTFKLEPGWCEGGNNITLLSTGKEVGSYIGQNAFGVKKVIRQSEIAKFCLEGTSKTQVTFPMARDKAKIEKQLAKFILIGRLKSPYAKVMESYLSPKIDSPYEVHGTSYVLKFDVKDIWIFSGLNGDILYRPTKTETLGSDEESEQESDEIISTKLDENGNTALHLAIWYGATKKAQKVIERKIVDLNACNKFGTTALHLAVAKGNLKVIQALIEAGVNTEIRDRDGATPLMDAKKIGHRGVIEALEKAASK